MRSLLAGFTLIVFTVSITPRIVFHTWFASHADITGIKQAHTTATEVSKAGFNCNCNSIVAESPFTPPVSISETDILQPFSKQQKIQICSFHSVKYFSFSLRGPPVQS